MPYGLPQDGNTLNSTVGSEFTQLRDILNRISNTNNYLTTQTAQQLVTAGLDSLDDATAMKTVVGIVAELNAVLLGQQAIPNPVNILALMQPAMGPF